jgi:hypothetical protein
MIFFGKPVAAFPDHARPLTGQFVRIRSFVYE